MTNRPIIFSGPMVREIIAGRKTMTRRKMARRWSLVGPGDRFWVRENWRVHSWDEDGHLWMRSMWKNWELDPADLQDTAKKYGIIKEEPYDPEKHGEREDVEPGDSWFVLAEG